MTPSILINDGLVETTTQKYLINRTLYNSNRWTDVTSTNLSPSPSTMVRHTFYIKFNFNCASTMMT